MKRDAATRGGDYLRDAGAHLSGADDEHAFEAGHPPREPTASGQATDGFLELWQAAPGRQRLWRRHSDVVNRALLARWLPRDPGAVLKTDLWDEALGDGLYPALADRAREVVGVDASEPVVEAAARRYPALTAVKADVRALPFEAARFDTVVSNSTLDHFDSAGEVAVALRELHRVLRPGGSLVLTLDNPANPLVGLPRAAARPAVNRLWLRLGTAAGRIGLLPYHVGATLGRRRLARLLAAEGFVVRDEAAIVHAPRAVAVLVANVLERRAGREAQERFLRGLLALERLGRWPTRFVTGHFVAVRATRAEAPARSRTVAPGSRRWSAGGAITRARDVRANDGLRALWFKLLGETVYRRVLFVELELDSPPPRRSAPVPLEFRLLDPGEAAAYTRLRPDTSVAEVRQRLARGERCFVALQEGRIVSARWVSEHEARIEYLDRTLPLAAHEVYVYETYTAPDYRGLGISGAAGFRLARELSAEGVERIVSAVVPENRSGIRAHEKAGYRVKGTLGYLRVGPWRRDFRR